MINIDEIMNMLDWNNSDEIQLKGIELAQEVKSINVFILPANPGNTKNVWENCAKILASKSDEILKPYLSRLLQWLEDLNWPGAAIILERLKNYSDTKRLSIIIKEFVKKAVAINDKMWLSSASEFLDSEEFKTFLPKDTRDILQNHYHNKD